MKNFVLNTDNSLSVSESVAAQDEKGNPITCNSSWSYSQNQLSGAVKQFSTEMPADIAQKCQTIISSQIS